MADTKKQTPPAGADAPANDAAATTAAAAKIPSITLGGGDDERTRAATFRVKESNPKKFAEAVTEALKQGQEKYAAGTFQATIIAWPKG